MVALVQREEIVQRVGCLIQALDESFLERRAHVRMALLTLLSGHHVLLLGPPGTAKSLLARALCRCVRGASYFEYLLSRFTHPDELFGPVSIPGLKEEDYRRLTTGYMPDAHVVFLDEIFKANSAILNSLLTLINERIFHHGVHRDQVPLLGVIGASNEPPDEDGGLGALYDRFLVRMAVPSLADGEHFLKVCMGAVPAFAPLEEEMLGLEEILWIRAESKKVRVGPQVQKVILELRSLLQREGVEASDRRWRWAVDLLKVAAFVEGREELFWADLLLLEHCFGTPFEDDTSVGRLIREAVEPGGALQDKVRPLSFSWNRIVRAPDARESWKTTRARRLELIEALEEEVQQIEADLTRERDAVMEVFADSLWNAEPPPEALAAFVGARRRVLEFKKGANTYRKRLEAFSLVEEVLSWCRTQRSQRSRARNFYEEDDEPVFWLSARGASEDSWIAVLQGGTMVSRPNPRGRLVEDVNRWVVNHRGEGARWSDHVVVLAVDEEDLWRWLGGSEVDWEELARGRFEALWSSYLSPGEDGLVRRAPGWDRGTAVSVFVDLVRQWRSANFARLPASHDLVGGGT